MYFCTAFVVNIYLQLPYFVVLLSYTQFMPNGIRKEVEKYMNKTELIQAVVEETGLKKQDAEKAVSATFAALTNAMKAGDSVQLIGFGTFKSVKQDAKTGRNPSTGETIQIPAKVVPKFVAGKGLKDALNA